LCSPFHCDTHNPYFGILTVDKAPQQTTEHQKLIPFTDRETSVSLQNRKGKPEVRSENTVGRKRLDGMTGFLYAVVQIGDPS
jgi:hypothetical protein